MTQSKTPKTGLAAQMRKRMKERRYFFTKNLCDDLKDQGFLRAQIAGALTEFLERGEIEKVPDKRILRQKYKYNMAYTNKRPSPKKNKVLKAIYVSNRFTVRDVELLSGQGRNYINKILRKLNEQGHVQVICRRSCAQGRGLEQIWRVTDRTEYKVAFSV